MSIDKVPYFCPAVVSSSKDENGNIIEEKCGKIMRPFDIFCWEKVGVCSDCLAVLETHIKSGASDIEEPLRTKILTAYDEIMKENAGKDFQIYK